MKSKHALRGLLARAPLASAVAVALLTAPAVHAYEFGKGDWTGSLDTTVSYGYSWRVADIDATRARLIAAGLDVTEVRNGRKPGTRIMTVRNGTCGIQTVLLERSPKPAD